MSDGRDIFGIKTEKVHCDRCRKKAYAFYTSDLFWRGEICGNCQEIVKKESRDHDGDCYYDFVRDQEPTLDEWAVSPYF